jgi:hypothetical protein
MFVAVVIIAASLYLLMLPTWRAKRFAELVRSGQLNEAEDWLPASMDHFHPYRQILRQAKQARMEPLNFSQLLSGKRGVIVGKGWGGRDVEFIVSFTTTSEGRNWLNYW